MQRVAAIKVNDRWEQSHLKLKLYVNWVHSQREFGTNLRKEWLRSGKITGGQISHETEALRKLGASFDEVSNQFM